MRLGDGDRLPITWPNSWSLWDVFFLILFWVLILYGAI